MTCHRVFEYFLIAVLFIVFAQSVFAQSGSSGLTGKDLLTMDMDDLDKEITDAVLFRRLKKVRIKLERKEYCGKHADKALETKEELEQLNLIRNKTTESYGQRAMEVKDENNKAIRDYGNCYKTHLRDDFRLRYKNILTFQSLEENYFNLVGRFEGIANLDEYIDRMSKIYKMRKETAPFGPSDDEVIGTIASIYNSVEVLPGGKGAGWLPVGPGYKLTIKDHLRTGYASMAGIRFSGSVNQGNAQSTVVNVHSNSHIVMEKFTKAVFGSPQSNTERVISLLRGTLHAIKNKLNQIKEKGKLRVVPSSPTAKASEAGSTFTIRTGDSTAVIRGTELGVFYNSETGIAEYHLDHGDAYVESGGRQVQLKPRTSLTVSRGQIGTLRPLSNALWDSIVANSGGGISNTKPQRVETAKLDTLKNNDIEAAAKARRNDAKSVAKSYFLAMKNYDEEAFLNVHRKSLRSDLKEILRKTSLKELVNKNTGRPMSYTIPCSLCSNKGNTCQLIAEVQMEADPIGQLRGVQFDIATDGPNSEFKVSGTMPASDGVRKSFMAGNPVCGEGSIVDHSRKQEIETAELDTLKNNDIAEAARARRNYAKSVAKSMLLAMKNYDKEALLNVLHESVRSDFEKDLRKTSLKEMSDKAKGRPMSYTMPCSICNKKGNECQVLADVQMEADPTGQLTTMLFDIKTNGRDSEFKVDNAPPADYAMIKTFMARNPFCGEN
jgi:hypothetical protein